MAADDENKVVDDENNYANNSTEELEILLRSATPGREHEAITEELTRRYTRDLLNFSPGIQPTPENRPPVDARQSQGHSAQYNSSRRQESQSSVNSIKDNASYAGRRGGKKQPFSAFLVLLLVIGIGLVGYVIYEHVGDGTNCVTSSGSYQLQFAAPVGSACLDGGTVHH
jgi:hypothetical protein